MGACITYQIGVKESMEDVFVETAVCPHCGKVAKGRKQIERDFGYRNMGDGTIRVQSWCRNCRIEERRQNG